LRRQESAFARRNAGRGGFSEAVIRIIIAVTGVDRAVDKRQVETADAIVRRHKLFEHHSPAEVKQMVRDQARILSAHNDLALSGLATMLPSQAEREIAFNVAIEIAVADFRVDLGERQVLTQIRKTLELHHNDLH
jgi:tellurite resistance protein